MFRRLFKWIRGPFVYLTLLGLLLMGAFNTLINLEAALEGYQPLSITVEPAQALIETTTKAGQTAPLTNRVVMIVVNGLSLEDAEALPALQAQSFKDISTGAYLFTSAVQPSTPAYVTLLTGAGLELTGGFTLDPNRPAQTNPTPAQQLAQFDNLFAAVKRSNFTTALFSTNDWYNALPAESLDYYTTFDPYQPANDVADNALNFLKKKSANFTLVQLSAMGLAQREYGFNSQPVLEARKSLNTALERFVGPEMNLQQTTVIITGDWDNSIRAGDRWTVPFTMVGQAVQPGEKIWGRQEDVASTIAALLGVQVPRHNQGRILSMLLSMPAIDQGEKFLALVEQRLALDTAYRLHLNLTLPLAINDPLAVEAEKNLKIAQQNYRLGSYDGIEGAADWILRYTRTDMEDARQEWFAEARNQRALLSAVLLVLPVLLLLIWRSSLAFLAFLAAIIAASLPYGIYYLQGRAFSFNAISLPLLQETALWQASVALFIGMLIPLLFFDWSEKRRKRRRGRIDLEYEQIAGLRRPAFPIGRLFACCALILAWLTYFSVYVWFVWYYWRYGYIAPLMEQPAMLPDYNASFLLIFALQHALGFALAMFAAPVIFVVLYWIKRKLSGNKADEEQDTLRKTRPSTDTTIIKA